MRLHHVQVACPPGGEPDARRFYGQGLGMSEVEKPAALVGRGGCWFRSYDEHGEVVAEIHVGVEDPFQPARKAHPALVLDSADRLHQVGAWLSGLGYQVDWSQKESFDGYWRFHTRDGHGNRVEVLAARV